MEVPLLPRDDAKMNRRLWREVEFEGAARLPEHTVFDGARSMEGRGARERASRE